MNITAMLEQAEACQAAGFSAAALDLRTKADRARRLMLAYEKYRYVKQEQIDAFCTALLNKTRRSEGHYPAMYECWDTLGFTPVNEYASSPPPDVLAKVAEAQAEKLFDTLEVAKIVSKREYRDPIVFGRIEGCPDRFYVAQWDDDVKIDDLIGPSEG